MNSKAIRASYSQYISERANTIIYSLDNNKRVLLRAPMKGGKTHLVLNNLSEYYNKRHIRIIFVSPVTLLIEQQGERAKGKPWGVYYGRSKCALNTTNIITTPDSLLKVIESIEEQESKFLLVIDEAHEEESSRGFRPAFKNIEEATKSPYFLSALYMTATPQNLERGSLDKFDKYIRLEQDLTLIGQDGKEEPNPHIFKHGEELIIKPLGGALKDKINLIEQVRRGNPESPLAIKLDNKKQLKGLRVFYNNISNISFIFLASEARVDEDELINKEYEEEAETLRDDISAYKEIGQAGELKAFTSLINSGVEINNKPGTIFINFTNSTYNFINEIQSIGRFRNGLRAAIIAIPQRDAEASVIKDYLTIYKEEAIAQERGKEALLTALSKHDPERVQLLKGAYKALEVSEAGAITIDEVTIRAGANNEYNRQFLDAPELLLKQFKEESGLLFDKYILDEQELEEFADVAAARERVEAGAKLTKELLKEEEQALKEELKESTEEELIAIVNNNPLGLDARGKERLERLKRLHREAPGTKKELEELGTCNLTELTALKLWISQSKQELKTLKEAYYYAQYNKIYRDNPQGLKELAYKGKKSERLKLKRLIATLEYINNNITLKAWLGKKHIIELINIYIELGLPLYEKFAAEQDEDKKKTLTKKLVKDVNKYLALICKTSADETGARIRITSIRTNIKDLIKLND